MPFPNRLILSIALKVAGTRPPDKAIRSSYASHLNSVTTQRILGDFTTESRGLFTDVVVQPVFPNHRGYVHTSDDNEIPAKLQRKFAQRLAPVHEYDMSTGHLPMLQDAQGLAATIQSFSAAVH